MCLGLCCDCLYKSRCLLWKLLPLLWLADLVLTIYIVVQLYQSDIFACCTHNMGALDPICGYEDLGGAANIAVNDYGYCQRKDTGKVCFEIGECAELVVPPIVPEDTNGVEGESFGDTLCTEEILDDVAFYNYFWLNGVLIAKCV
eukprot:UN08494